MIKNIRQEIKQAVFLLILCFVLISFVSMAKGQTSKAIVDQPVTVNGDTVEYATEKKEVTATGNVSVDYKGTKLRCNKLTVNTQTKDATAEGNVRIEDKDGVMYGEKIIYNFNTQKGTLVNAKFSSSPYFGKSEEIQRVNEKKFISLRGYATTCDFDRPHYNLRAKKVVLIPGDKIQTRQDTLFIGQTPMMYLPYYSHSLKDPLMHVQLSPGYSKDWGAYLLSAWRYNLTDNVNGRIYLDYRDRRGLAGGFGANYNSINLGKADLKFYYMHENDTNLDVNQPHEFQRYFVRLRHKWDIDERNNLISEYYKIVDSKRILLGTEYNVLKDYFPREYEKDAQPLSYSFFHHSFTDSSMDVLVQKRTNRWYSQIEKLPEVRYSLPSMQLAELPLYFENNTQAANFNQKNAVPSPSGADVSLNRFDTFNKITLPVKLSFIDLSPFIAGRQTYYDKDINGASIGPRTVFYTGAQASTKFYRIFDVKPDFLGMEINGLRHIITPTISYAYNHDPTIRSTRLRQMDAVDSIALNNAANFELSNKLQTKRNGQAVDFLDFIVSNTYTFYKIDPLTDEKSGGNLADYLFELKFLPYSRVRLDADADYNHEGDYFSNANYDINFNLGEERSIGLGQRYQRKGANELTFNSDCRISPKWKFRVYERYQFKETADIRHGLVKQEYTFSRDLHCWLVDLTYTIEKEHGNTIWCIFRLKAFPEAEIDFSQSYYRPSSGSQP